MTSALGESRVELHLRPVRSLFVSGFVEGGGSELGLIATRTDSRGRPVIGIGSLVAAGSSDQDRKMEFLLSPGEWVVRSGWRLGAAADSGDALSLTLPVQMTGDEDLRFDWSEIVAGAADLRFNVEDIGEDVDVGIALRVADGSSMAFTLLERKGAGLLRSLVPGHLDLWADVQLARDAVILKEWSIPCSAGDGTVSVRAD